MFQPAIQRADSFYGKAPPWSPQVPTTPDLDSAAADRGDLQPIARADELNLLSLSGAADIPFSSRELALTIFNHLRYFYRQILAASPSNSIGDLTARE